MAQLYPSNRNSVCETESQGIDPKIQYLLYSSGPL